MTEPSRTGRCLCGEVTYELEAIDILKSLLRRSATQDEALGGGHRQWQDGARGETERGEPQEATDARGLAP